MLRTNGEPVNFQSSCNFGPVKEDGRGPQGRHAGRVGVEADIQ